MGIECPEDEEDVDNDEHDEEQALLDVPSNVPGSDALAKHRQPFGDYAPRSARRD